MAATTSSAPPPFSYAQAAKGLAPTTSQPQNTPSAAVAESTTLTEKKSSDRSPENAPWSTSTADAPHASPDDQRSDNKSAHTAIEHHSETAATGDDRDRNQGHQADPPSSQQLDRKPTSDHLYPALSKPESIPTQNHEQDLVQNEAEEVRNRHHEAAVGPGGVLHGEIWRNNTEDESSVSVPATKVDSELKAAPMPTVNIWVQRKEAHEAKAKATAASRGPNLTAGSLKAKAQTQSPRSPDQTNSDAESKVKDGGKAGDVADGFPKKKMTDDSRSREDGKRASRPARTGEMRVDLTPAVGDTESWPTPKIANHEEKKKPSYQEKSEKSDAKSAGVKPNQKWVPVPYVPTARFNTPLPPTASRRGGRSSRGGREGGNRGAHLSHASGSDRSDRVRSTGPASAPPHNSQSQRGRDLETESEDRAASVAISIPRASSAGPHVADSRRPTPATMSERGSAFENKKSTRGEAQDLVTAAGGDDPSQQTRGFPSSSSRPSSSSFRSGPYDSTRMISGESHSHPFRTSSASEKRSANDGYERSSEHTGRRDRHDSSKDSLRFRDVESRPDSWRDRESLHDRPETRSGRGRGSYRGRGSHSQSVQTHAFSAPLPQQSFSAGKAHGQNPRSRQSSTAYSGMPSQSHQRNNSRSQPMSSPSMYAPVSNAFPAPISTNQADMNAMYHGYPSMYSGVMSAIPYTPTLEPMALMSMVAAQLEYYFSIENLCKDMYLRSNMNSQGWVPLRVIAGFNRIKSLTEDMNLIRHVCQISRNIEFQPAEDGADRVRKADKWEQWVLDVERRQPHAQVDTPPTMPRSQSPSQSNTIFPAEPQATSPGALTSGSLYGGYAVASRQEPGGLGLENAHTTPPHSAPLPEIPAGENFSLTNGRTGHPPGHGVDVPGYASPHGKAPGGIPNGPVDCPIANGNRPASPQEIGVENAFSNERIHELHVCVRHPTHQVQPPFMNAGHRTFSHGSIDGAAPRVDRVVTPLPSLRGGAGSPESPDPVRERPLFLEKSNEAHGRGVFWMKDGAPPDSWDQEGSTVEKYQSLYDRAVAERIPGTVSDDMEWLYQFWSHFLVRNFNQDMYHDFRSTAWEDASAGYEGGLNRLEQYYGALLNGARVLTEQLAEDIVRLADYDMENRRPMFRSLRSAWRNGAFNLKSRKKIDKFVGPELKDALEK